jgi:hypothetical protein
MSGADSGATYLLNNEYEIIVTKMVIEQSIIEYLILWHEWMTLAPITV